MNLVVQYKQQNIIIYISEIEKLILQVKMGLKENKYQN